MPYFFCPEITGTVIPYHETYLPSVLLILVYLDAQVYNILVLDVQGVNKLSTISEQKKPKEFIEALSYPAKKHRPLAKWPLSVPYDPIITDFIPFNGKKSSPKNFFYSLIFTAFDVRDYGPDIKKFIKIFAPLNLKRVYLETYRDGYTADKETLVSAKKELEKEGFLVSGCVTTTHFSDKAKYNESLSASGCYTDKTGNRNMKKVFEMTASIFDEIIIDDWFFTNCRCKDCEKGKKTRNWNEFRSRIISEAAKKYIIEPAKKVNPKVKIILKLPNWYQDYYDKGYDLKRLLPLFDEIAVGTETRDYKTGRYLPVHGSMLMKYIKTLAPEKTKRAWFDIYQCDEKIFVEQAYQSLLGGAEEIILFCAGILPQPSMRPLVEALLEVTDKIDRLSNFKNIFSIPVIREANTYGETNLHQYLLMLGAPAFLTPFGKFREKFVILTEQSGKKSDFAKMFNQFLKERKDMLITINFAREIKKYFDVKDLKEEIRAEFVKYAGRTTVVEGEAYITSEVTAGKHLALINGAYSYISCFKIKNSKVFVLNLPYSTDKITNIIGDEEPSDYRFILKSPGLAEPIKSVLKSNVSNVMYDKIKTMGKFEI
jgi:hypothetical protein